MNQNNYSVEAVSLEDALNIQNSSGRPVKTFVGFNTGNRTFTMNLSLFEVQEMTEVANEQSKNSQFISQRKLDITHANAIAKYILKGLLSAALRKKKKQGTQVSNAFQEIQKNLGYQPYLSIPPLVASFRNCDPNGTNLKVTPLITIADQDTACFKIYVNPGDTFWVIDGQHRRKGLQLTAEFLNYVMTYHKYPARASLYKGDSKSDMSPEELQVWIDCNEMMRSCSVVLEVHLGLGIDEERQLFHDLNNLGKKVDKSLALQFDGSNPINTFIGEVLLDDLFSAHDFPLSTAKEKGDWNHDGFTRQELVSINSLLFLNKTNINGATPAVVEPKIDVAKDFWERVLQIDGITIEGSKQLTVAAQPVVLKALAKLVYDFRLGKNKEWVSDENAAVLMESITSFDFSHSNPIWRYYELNETERKSYGLEELQDYLPSETEGFNRDIGKYDDHAKVFRFGAKHNDIYPIIGDMIRWRLGLPSRKK